MARPMPLVSPCAPWLCRGTSTPTGLARAATTRLVALRATTSMASSITPTGSTIYSSPPPWEGENYEPRNPMESVIFTLPHDLSALALQNPRHLYGLLLRTVAQTLQDIAGDPKHLGAEIGGFAVLHTWGQQLHHHPHLHCVLPAGGVAPDGPAWVACRPHFFLPIRVLSRRFRQLYLAGLEHLYSQGQLTLTGRCQGFVEPQPWHQFLADMLGQEWVVYAKPPLQEPHHVLTYLARYTHRVAISNHRLVALEGGQVTFRYKDYQRGHRLRTLTLDAVEFLRRLMLHVPPRGFHRLRHFGFLANRVRQEKLAQCRTLLGHTTRPPTRDEATDLKTPEVSAGEPGSVCPVCQHGRMHLVQTLYRQPTACTCPMRIN